MGALSRRHDHSMSMDMGMGMDMGGMSMGGGLDPFYLQQMFWAVVGTAIGIATLVNVINRCISWQR